MHLRTLLALLLAAAASLVAQQPNAAVLDLFERKIRPVLVERCWSCHSSNARISFAGLQLDTKARTFRGSDAGAVIVPGKPAESRLYQALRYEGQAKMPPAGKLTAEVIENFRVWIEQGAPWPEEREPAAPTATKAQTPKPRVDHWAWKPVKKLPPPPVRAANWPLDPLDQFVLAQLEERGLEPVADASREQWLRRVTLDLTGLPPTLAERESFLADASPSAWATVVDRLLGSTAFGQRWGRHWLDQTYYADNIEIGRRVPARHAWRYRDYVIEAINRDVPYNRFLLEQLAGEQLPAATPEERRRNIIATGFLALGPWPLVNADKEQLRMDVVDLQVDMVGRTTMGLTMGCARCHDHKFDPISLRDYYGMAGIFASTRTLNGRLGLSVFSNVNTLPLPESPEEMMLRAEETRQHRDKLTSLQQTVRDLRARRKAMEKDSADAKALDKEILRVDTEVKLLEYLPPVPPTAHAVEDLDTPADCRINVRGNAHQLGEATPRSFVAVAAGDHKVDIADWRSGRKELADWLGSKENPLTARVLVNRVWHHLFGTGIVATIDNFGTRGDSPSHPQLLDYLAAEFVDNGWSVKKLVRRVVLSRVYRLSGEANAKAMEVDPENRLLWRMSRRRLEAETIRDAMLAVSGLLDRTEGGPALPLLVPGNVNLANPQFLKEEATLEPAARTRRSIYLPVLRKSQMPELDILNLFNFPDVNQITGPRVATTIPTQALYLMNAPFVAEQAAALARVTLQAAGSDEDRMAGLVRRVYARDAAADEVRQLLEYVREYASRQAASGAREAREEAWKRLCHSLLISNEFLYRS
jgi:hypothetical protein